MLSRFSILKKGLLLIAVPLGFQIGFIGLVAVMRMEATSAERWRLHTQAVIAQSQTLRARMLTAHGSVQGFTITQDPSFGVQSDAEIGAVGVEAARLLGMVDDNSGQKAIARRIEAEVKGFAGFLDEAVKLLRAGQVDGVVAANRRRTAQSMLDRINRDLGAFLDEENRLDLQRRDRVAQAWRRFDLLLTTGTVASVLCTVLFARLFSRNISGRISVLASNVQRLAEGKELAPNLRGVDEIARLDRVFHEMATTLDLAARAERANAELNARRAEELATVNDQLREKNQENEMFVYSVSHDLRSPLVNLQGFSKELGLIGKDLRSAIDRDEVPSEVRRKVIGMIDVDVSESIGFIQTAVTRLSAIIDALLRLSRAGRIEYRRQQVDVDAVVRRVVAALGRTIAEKGATVTIGELPPTFGDPTAIEQVFANLVGNALNYLAPARPGVVAIEVEDAAVRHPLAPPGTVIYAVRDNGLGIPDAYKSKVFTAFQRLHGDVAKGEGVGLALVRRMVERHGGRVWFESTPGRGSTFFVAFPAGEVSSREDGPSVVSS